MIGLLIVFLIVCAFISGYNFHARRSRNYKKRWQEALGLYEEERTKTLTMGMPSEALDSGQPLFTERELMRARTDRAMKYPPRYQKGPNDARRVLDTLRASKSTDVHSTADDLKTLRRLSDHSRYVAEGARLDNKIPVIDDLQGMNDYHTTRMLQRRAQHGIY